MCYENSKGNTITSYALILGLVVILSIPAIMLLGDSIFTNLEATASEENQQQMNNLVGLLNKDSSTKQISTNLPVIISDSVFKNGEKITIVVNSDVNTTSTNGQTEAMVMGLEEIINNAIASGEITDDDTKFELEALIEAGYALAEVEHDEINSDSCHGWESCYSNEQYYYSSDVVQSVIAFGEAYEAVSSSDTFTGETADVITGLSAQIGQLVDEGFIERMYNPMNPNKRNQLNNARYYTGFFNTVETDIKDVEITDIPPETIEATDQLSALSH